MVIINAYLGAGSGGGVPVGKCLLNVAWNPSDGNNKSGATVRAVIGSTTVTGTTDSSGNVSLLVGTGSCTVTVTPTAGSYTATSATVTAESTTTKTVVISGQAGRKVTLVVPYTLTTTSWNIKDSGNTQKASGSGAFNDKEVTLLDGSYTLTLVAYGVTKTKTFTVSSTSTRIDCTDITCVVTFAIPPQLAITMKVQNVALASNQTTVCVLRNSAALAYSGTVTTNLDGSAIATITSGNMTPSNATLRVVPTVTGSRKLITSTKTINIPVKGYYKIIVIGGGGGGGYYNGTSTSAGGGGSGHVAYEIVRLNTGNQTVTIGTGGAKGAAGGASSFGSILSASGGSAGARAGGAGGAGGGGGGGWQLGPGGNASFGGGGGSGGYSGTSGNIGGGTAGPYGGAGGDGQWSPKTSQNGASGKAIDNSDSFFSSTGSGYGGGTTSVNTNRAGGGGGGGYGAKGGNASSVVGTNGASGGGGGGIAGGNGGNGLQQKVTANTYAGHGLGYGSGGGGGIEPSSGSLQVAVGGGGGGLYNISYSGAQGANGAVQIMWVG